MKHKITIATLAIIFLASGVTIAQAVSIGPAGEYNPQVSPADFSTNINNPFFSIPVGKKMVYEKTTEDGKERIEILVPGWTRTVMGVETLVFWDRVYLNDVLIEDTRDYLAQHKNGDVWYFGEHVDNYENGKLKDHHGAWLAGVNGAKPGIWMLANPKVGDEFRNEYYKGEAEDITKIVAVNETVVVPFGTLTDCVKTFDWTPLDSTSIANKYFCKQPAGGTALEVDLPGPKRKVAEKSELVLIDIKGAFGARLPGAYASEGVIATNQSGTDGTGEENEREWFGKDHANDADDNEREDSDGLLWIIISGLAGLVGGVLLQKFVIGKSGSRIS
jgi:hypothetical protein